MMILRPGIFRHKVLLRHRVCRMKLGAPMSPYHNRLPNENIVKGWLVHQHRHRNQSRSFVYILAVPSHVVVLDSIVTLASTHLLRILT